MTKSKIKKCQKWFQNQKISKNEKKSKTQKVPIFENLQIL